MKWALVVMLATLVAPALAEWKDARGNDLEKCVWYHGKVMDDRDCNLFRRQEQAKAADAALGQRLLEESHRKAAEQKERQDAIKAEQQAKADAFKKKFDEEQAEWHKRTEKIVDENAEEMALEEAARKKRCGKDYQALRIGMTVERVDDCYSMVVYETTTVTAKGTIDTYHTTFHIINFTNGKLSSYTRRTH